MSHVMLDIETLGTKPGCVILSIGACVFDPKGDDAFHDFYQNICPHSCLKEGLRTDPDTVAWWKKQSDAAVESLKKDRVDVRTALSNFTKWFSDHVTGEQVWCQGATFDVPIVQEAMEITGVQTPWKFWNVRDTRTVYDICAFDPRMVEREGTYHNALDDAKHQVKCVQEALKNVRT